MHQIRKGNQWYFGLKAHIGADRDSKFVHTVVCTMSTLAEIEDAVLRISAPCQRGHLT